MSMFGGGMKAFWGFIFCFCKCRISNTKRIMYKGEAAEKGGTHRTLQASVQIHGTVTVPSGIGSATIV